MNGEISFNASVIIILLVFTSISNSVGIYSTCHDQLRDWVILITKGILEATQQGFY